jgi:catechol 2,3-dioxygenase-like lactoylglutathione lyase family enzyme
MPTLSGIIETALYVDDADRSSKFYEDILGLRLIFSEEDRLRAYSVADRDVLLLFKRGATTQPIRIPAGLIPPHDGSGQNHFALAVSANELAAWETHLAAHSIEIESRAHWPLGGTSIYFRDPDGHLVELATPGMWSIY